MVAAPSKVGRTTLPRASKKHKSGANAIPGEEDDKPEKVHVIKKNPKKRAKGKLSGLIDLPIDVLFEIFGHLKPFDLLKVARVSKEFRRLLMHRSSKSVWQTALKSIPDLPPCPPDLDEPAWVNLVFDPHCHFCVKATVRVVEWTLRVRICGKCANIEFCDPDDLDKHEHSPENLVLSRPGKRPYFHEVISDDLEKMKVQFAAFADEKARLAFILERRKLLSDIKAHAALCVTWAQAQTHDRSSELRQLRIERRKAIIEKLKGLGYEKDIASIRRPHSLADHELVKKPQKLTDRVWANIREGILKFMDQMREMRLEREHIQRLHNRKSSAVVVYRGYLTGLYPHSDVMPSGVDFCGFPPVKEILEQPDEADVDEASFVDIIPLIPDFIASWRRSVDLHLREVTKSSRPYSEGRDWNKFDEFVGDINEGTLTDPDKTGDTLLVNYKLATTVFHCSNCSYEQGNLDDRYDVYDLSDDEDGGKDLHQPLFYPKVKGHRCLRRTGSYDWMDEIRDPVLADPTRQLCDGFAKRRQWSAHPLRVNTKLGECVKILVQKAGLDPETTTADDLDRLGLWFACLKCAHDCGEKEEKVWKPEDDHPYEMPAFTWRLAVEHYMTEHRDPTVEPAWSKIGSEQIDEAAEAFKQNPKSTYKPQLEDGPVIRPIPKDATWSCIHCRDTRDERAPTSLEIINKHLLEQHQKTQPEENIDYYKDFAALPPPMRQRQVVVSLSDMEAQQAAPRKQRHVRSRLFNYIPPQFEYDFEDFDSDF
ncbi:hypothetical protein DXG01_005503 [Tephrocybe rancida]|nr:hypothetical protein DXG01_005503 [Tephrocybe rancida]